MAARLDNRPPNILVHDHQWRLLAPSRSSCLSSPGPPGTNGPDSHHPPACHIYPGCCCRSGSGGGGVPNPLAGIVLSNLLRFCFTEILLPSISLRQGLHTFPSFLSSPHATSFHSGNDRLMLTSFSYTMILSVI